jgi:hypothetical protein
MNKLTWRDGIYIISLIVSIGIVVITFSNKFTLLQDQVNRNQTELETHDLGLLEYKLNEMDQKLDKITELLEER